MMIIARIAILLLLGAATSTPYAQTLYKSVDPSGRVVYSDKPPTDGKVEKTIQVDIPPSSVLPGAPGQGRKVKTTSTSAMTDGDVILFSAVWCGICKKAKAYLDKKGIAYREIDIDTSEGKKAFKQAGGKGVPLLVAGGQNVRGFRSEKYDQFFASQK